MPERAARQEFESKLQALIDSTEGVAASTIADVLLLASSRLARAVADLTPPSPAAVTVLPAVEPAPEVVQTTVMPPAGKVHIRKK
jgi:hypothetical protein